MVGTQFHPEFKSRPNRAHPLFVGLVRAAKLYRDSKPNVREEEDGGDEETAPAELFEPDDALVATRAMTDDF